ncbi:MAG: polyamine aminopropyltransferase [bacterium]
MQGLGKHILAEFYGCDFEKLNDPELLKTASLDAVRRSGATIMSHHFKVFEPQGVSGVIVIAESHLSFHTWPEHGYAAVDYFTCGDRIDIHLAVDVLALALQPSHTERKVHWRGEELADEPHRPSVQHPQPDASAPSISSHAGAEEHWITEYQLCPDTQRRLVGYSYLASSKVIRERGMLQELAVAESPLYGRMLFIDGYLMTTERDEFVYHEMLAHVPMVLHPRPRRVLIIGGGDGGLLREVLRHRSVEHVDLVEIDASVIEVCRKCLPGHAVGFDDPRAHVHVQDGAAFAAAAERDRYDVVLVDSTDPVGPAKVLFEAPFFRALRRALTPEGVLAAQSLSPWIQARQQAAMYHELGLAWPHVLAYHATIPTYPGGQWTFAVATNGVADPTAVDRPRAAAIGQRCRYYTPELQVAAFHLPRFVRGNTVEVARAARDRVRQRPVEASGRPPSSAVDPESPPLG